MWVEITNLNSLWMGINNLEFYADKKIEFYVGDDKYLDFIVDDDDGDVNFHVDEEKSLKFMQIRIHILDTDEILEFYSNVYQDL